MFKEFKEFAFKGNLVDMAVGFIMGGAFGTFVKSIVDNLVMPLVGQFTGGVNFSSQYAALDGKEYESLAKAQELGAPVLGYGQVISDFISFLLLAFAVFIIVKKFMGSMMPKEEEAPAAPPKQEVLLEEIRDLLKK